MFVDLLRFDGERSDAVCGRGDLGTLSGCFGLRRDSNKRRRRRKSHSSRAEGEEAGRRHLQGRCAARPVKKNEKPPPLNICC